MVKLKVNLNGSYRRHVGSILFNQSTRHGIPEDLNIYLRIGSASGVCHTGVGMSNGLMYLCCECNTRHSSLLKCGEFLDQLIND